MKEGSLFVLSCLPSWNLPIHISFCYALSLGHIGNLSMNKGELSWFHNVNPQWELSNSTKSSLLALTFIKNWVWFVRQNRSIFNNFCMVGPSTTKSPHPHLFTKAFQCFREHGGRCDGLGISMWQTKQTTFHPQKSIRLFDFKKKDFLVLNFFSYVIFKKKIIKNI